MESKKTRWKIKYSFFVALLRLGEIGVLKFLLVTANSFLLYSVWKYLFKVMDRQQILLLMLKFRNSHWRCSVRKGVLRNFAKFTEKHLCEVLIFNKVAGLRRATFLTKRLWHRCFHVNFLRFLRTPFLQNTSRRTWAKNIFFVVV